jgi:hypothetical protein
LAARADHRLSLAASALAASGQTRVQSGLRHLRRLHKVTMRVRFFFYFYGFFRPLAGKS